MNGHTKILPTHVQRQGVVYLRQSSPKQVLQNRESAVNQRALTGRLLEWGWPKHQIVVIDEDQGLSGKHASGREGFQKLAADVSLGKVGIVIGYEVSRLSRNCADWHRLLELCALFDTLVADADGIYHPRDFNDRLLLGLKGTLSEAELHSLRLRLDAGRLSKAKRGELVQHLPTGFTRTTEGEVGFDPDASVKARIELVFHKFLEMGTVHKVLGYLVRNQLKVPRRQTSGLYAGQTLWKDPADSALYSILKNPAYAGAFAYGRRIAEPTRQIPGRPATGRLRQPRSRWTALVPDVYPAYVTWNEFERIQRTIEENRQRMQEQYARKRAIHQGAALLTGLVRCGRCGHAMGVAYKDRRFQYKCDVSRTKYAKASCQFLSGYRIDETVVQAFFRVLHPAQIDALEKVTAKQAEHHDEQLSHLQQEVARYEYAAKRAERQYDCVDPENRLITATLEKKWEQALIDLEQAKATLIEVSKEQPSACVIPLELRAAFSDLGRRLPDLWPRVSLATKKALIRTLVSGVNLARGVDGMVTIRIVWRGGLVSEERVRVPVHSLQYSQTEQEVAERIRHLAGEGFDTERIIEQLNKEGFVACRGGVFTRPVVVEIKQRYGIVSNLGKVRTGNLPGVYTVREMAEQIGIHPSWIYRQIGAGVVRIGKNARYGVYLFPRTTQSVTLMKRLRKGELPHVSFPTVHCDG
ncbi:MAG TPA: recombinase family protein [Verrucomicrobiota bacterium]|nr:recombinase family protein [Verrucomicrobiota bacterium]